VEQLLRLMAAHGHAGAADELGVAPITLYRVVRRLGIVEQAEADMRTHRRPSGLPSAKA